MTKSRSISKTFTVLASNFPRHVFLTPNCSCFQNIFRLWRYYPAKNVCVYFGEERHKERDERKVCVQKKHPLIHSVTQFPWWFELYLTMWRTFSASTFAVSHLHLFQCTELKVWMVPTGEKWDKMTFGSVSGPGDGLERTSGWVWTGWTVTVVNG